MTTTAIGSSTPTVMTASDAYGRYLKAAQELEDELGFMPEPQAGTVDAVCEAYRQICAANVASIGDAAAMIQAVLHEVEEGHELTALDRRALMAAQRYLVRGIGS